MAVSPKNLSQIHHRKTAGGGGFGVVTYRRGGKFGPRTQRDFQLVVVHRGSAEIWVEGRKLLLGPGMGVLLRPHRVERFQFSRKEETRHSWCQLAPHEVPDAQRFPEAAMLRPAPCPEAVLELIRLGLREIVPPSGVAPLVLSAIWSFCASVSAEPEGVAVVHEPALERFQRAMEKRLAEAVTLADLAQEAGVSRGHLIKLVSEKWGATPMEVFWRHRTDAGARLLRETGLTIGEVADRTGFANPYHFSRRFRQRYGASPRVWRLRCWGPSE